MTNCRQFPTALADVKHQRATSPTAPIQYCQENTDNLQDYKACLRGIRQQVSTLDVQIGILSNAIQICDALIGTWIIHSTNAIVNGQQFTITAWDDQGPLTTTFKYNDGSLGQVAESDYVSVLSSFPAELSLLIGDLFYTAELDRSTPSPQFINGQVGGMLNSAWTATKS